MESEQQDPAFVDVESAPKIQETTLPETPLQDSAILQSVSHESYDILTEIIIENNNKEIDSKIESVVSVDKKVSIFASIQDKLADQDTQTNGFERGVDSQQGTVSEGAINGLSDEINAKFEMLANEVGELKDIVLKLQSFTMEVNKTLYEERIQMLSDMEMPANPSLTLSTEQHDNIVFDLSEDGDVPQ